MELHRRIPLQRRISLPLFFLLRAGGEDARAEVGRTLQLLDVGDLLLVDAVQNDAEALARFVDLLLRVDAALELEVPGCG